MFVPQRIPPPLDKGKKEKMKVKKGWLAVTVGLDEEEERKGNKLQRFLIPMSYLRHPLFKPLMEKAQEVYGFSTTGPLRLPCSVDEFLCLRSHIESDQSSELDLALYLNHHRPLHLA